MDPLTALSVASSVVQLVDFSLGIVKKSIEIYHSVDGSLEQNSRIETSTTDLQNLLQRLAATYPTAGDASDDINQEELKKIKEGCQEIGTRLLACLEKIKLQQSKGKFRSAIAAFKSAWMEDEILEMKGVLEQYRQEINCYVLVSLREKVVKIDLDQSQRFKDLDESTRSGIEAIIGLMKSQSDDFHGENVRQHTETRLLAQRNHDEIMEALINPSPSNRQSLRAKHEQEDASILPKAQKESAARLVLSWLSFHVMKDREEQIKDSYQNTFEWIFKDPKSDDRPWNNFSIWLKTPNAGLYWINGKAGSGKSTLMNFVYNHASLRNLLSIWSEGKPIIYSNFFFWNSGGLLQRTQKGLLRSLLHQILKSDYNLIPFAFPNYMEWVLQHERGEGVPYWHELKLQESLVAVCKQTSIPLKLSLFVDGLDEYEGEPGSLASFFKNLASYPNLKICVSSRPLVVFGNAFRGVPSLRLEYLTFEDIQFYVQDKLKNDEMMDHLCQRENQKEVEALLIDIIQKSSGVFLWIQVVVRSLLDGLTNEDGISDLQARVDALPEEIEDLFTHMLNKAARIETYRARGSRIFQIMRVMDSLGALHLFFSLQSYQYTLEANIEELSIEGRKMKIREVSRWLKTDCCGLLEVFHGPVHEEGEIGPAIQYIHRTARDYLDKPDVWSRILDECPEYEYNPHLALLCGAIHGIKTTLKPENLQQAVPPEAISWLANAMMHATYIKGESLHKMIRLLEEGESTMMEHWRSWLWRRYQHMQVFLTSPNHEARIAVHESIRNTAYSSSLTCSSMLECATHFGVVEYVQAKLENSPVLATSKSLVTLLNISMRSLGGSEVSENEWGNLRMAHLLLSKLVNFTTRQAMSRKGFTPASLRVNLPRYQYDDEEMVGLEWIALLELFLHHGTDPRRVSKVHDTLRNKKKSWSLQRLLDESLKLTGCELAEPYMFEGTYYRFPNYTANLQYCPGYESSKLKPIIDEIEGRRTRPQSSEQSNPPLVAIQSPGEDKTIISSASKELMVILPERSRRKRIRRFFHNLKG